MAVQVSHCGGAVVGWGPTSVTAYLPWPRGVTPSLDTISFMTTFRFNLFAEVRTTMFWVPQLTRQDLEGLSLRWTSRCQRTKLVFIDR